jgi:hypothetical protein
MRAKPSVPPPGGNGTTKRTGREGKSWPPAGAAARTREKAKGKREKVRIRRNFVGDLVSLTDFPLDSVNPDSRSGS